MKLTMHAAAMLFAASQSLCAPAAAQGAQPIAPNPLIEQMTKSGADESIVVLQGYVGQSSAAVVTLYDDLTMTRYLEIPRSEIVNVFKLGDRDTDPISIFVKGSSFVVSAVRHRAADANQLALLGAGPRGGHASGYVECERIFGEIRCRYVVELLQ